MNLPGKVKDVWFSCNSNLWWTSEERNMNSVSLYDLPSLVAGIFLETLSSNPV